MTATPEQEIAREKTLRWKAVDRRQSVPARDLTYLIFTTEEM